MATRIYLDHAATTPVAPEVFAAMQPFLAERFGNPSSLHGRGREARLAVDEARRNVARLLGSEPDEIVFTGSGTEADNFALAGVALRQRQRGQHLVITEIEHHAVLHCAEFLETLGFATTRVPVDGYGRVAPDAVASALRDDTVLVSIMLANNEVGTLQPMREIAALAHTRGALVHTDAVQAVGNIAVNVNDLGVDLLSLSAHKFYGPKGIGALYLRRGVEMVPWIHGGGQERGRRSGTENVAGIVGLGAAAELAQTVLRDENVSVLRNELERGLMKIDGARVNGHPTERLPRHLHISFPGAPGESLLMNLDLAGIAASAGSACASGATVASHVLRAMGLTPEIANCSVRFSLGRGTTKEEIETAAAAVTEMVAALRKKAGARSLMTAR